MIYGILVLLICVALGVIIKHLLKARALTEDGNKGDVILEKVIHAEENNRQHTQQPRDSLVKQEEIDEKLLNETMKVEELTEGEEPLEVKKEAQKKKSELSGCEDFKPEMLSIEEDVEELEAIVTEEKEEEPLPCYDLDHALKEEGLVQVIDNTAARHETELKPDSKRKRERFQKITEEDIGKKIHHFNYGEGIIHSIVKDHYVRIDFLDIGTVLFPIGLTQNGGIMKLIKYKA